jgi:hypothetical protein
MIRRFTLPKFGTLTTAMPPRALSPQWAKICGAG